MPLKPDDMKTVEKYKAAIKREAGAIKAGTTFAVYKDITLPNASGKLEKLPMLILLGDVRPIKEVQGKTAQCSGTCAMEGDKIAFTATHGTLPDVALNGNLLGKHGHTASPPQAAAVAPPRPASPPQGVTQAAVAVAPPRPAKPPVPAQAAANAAHAAPPPAAPPKPAAAAASYSAETGELKKLFQRLTIAMAEWDKDTPGVLRVNAQTVTTSVLVEEICKRLFALRRLTDHPNFPKFSPLITKLSATLKAVPPQMRIETKRGDSGFNKPLFNEDGSAARDKKGRQLAGPEEEGPPTYTGGDPHGTRLDAHHQIEQFDQYL